MKDTPVTREILDDSGTAAHQHGYISDKERYLARMKRIEGQARGIANMIDDERYCIDILTQVSALTRADAGNDVQPEQVRRTSHAQSAGHGG